MILTPNEMKEAEQKSFLKGFSEKAYVEKAGEAIGAFVHHFVKKYALTKKVTLLCGKGNNAADAFFAGIVLLKAGYKVEAMIAMPLESGTPLCFSLSEEFKKEGGVFLNEMPFFDDGVILDGLFGTGFKGSIEEPFKSIIEAANHSSLPILSIDIPSGLNGETGEVKTVAIEAKETYALGCPKLGLFLRKGWNHTGTIHVIDFGLDKKFLPHPKYKMTTEEEAIDMLPPLKRDRHKYEAGHVVAFAGSKEMRGAANLSTFSAIRGGAGLVHLLAFKETSFDLKPEVMLRFFETAEEALELMEKADAVFIGPGISKEERVKTLLKTLFSKTETPLVIDADALTLIAEEKLAIPKGAILTPHHGEMGALLGKKLPRELSEKEIHLCQAFTDKHEITLVLKGAPTLIFHPKSVPTFNPTGCPGMATAGSGDVLTGLIAALLAQKCPPKEAATLGCYLHGLAGQHAEEALGPYSMIASDIINHFPQSFFFEEV
jgi:NAD(P)H-hydrate epimerase